MKQILFIILFTLAPMLTERGLQIGEIAINNKIIKIMKMDYHNPAWLQDAGNRSTLFYIQSEEDNNEITFNGYRMGEQAEKIQYKTYKMGNWQQLTEETIILLHMGEKVYFRNYTNQDLCVGSTYKLFGTSSTYSIGGDITALFYPSTMLPEQAFRSAFRNDNNIKDASRLICSKTLSRSCYSEMFYGCTSLTQAPELPATKLEEECYCRMLMICTSLTQAPELPATELAPSCYSEMFYNCPSLTQAPELPATELVEGCYHKMFYACKSLELIICHAISVPSGCTSNWSSGVSATGTFKKMESAIWSIGSSGIPTGWTAVNL